MECSNTKIYRINAQGVNYKNLEFKKIEKMKLQPAFLESEEGVGLPSCRPAPGRKILFSSTRPIFNNLEPVIDLF
jgi:hypothetical protein